MHDSFGTIVNQLEASNSCGDIPRMWIPKTFAQYITFSVEELSTLRAENALLRNQLTKAEIMSDWFRVKVNQLEIQNAALMEKAFNIKVPVPEIVRPNAPLDPSYDPKNFDFNDMGEDLARKLGYPVYSDNTTNN